MSPEYQKYKSMGTTKMVELNPYPKLEEYHKDVYKAIHELFKYATRKYGFLAYLCFINH